MKGHEQKPDPMTFVEFDQPAENFDYFSSIAVEKETGEEYFKIRSPETAKVQQTISLILKGIINIADIIKIGDAYYSKSTDSLDEIEVAGTRVTSDTANQLLLAVFHDWDRDRADSSNPRNQKREDDAYYVFDFDVTFHSFLSERGDFISFISTLDYSSLEAFYNALTLLSLRISGSEGVDFMQSVFKKVHGRSSITLRKLAPEVEADHSVVFDAPGEEVDIDASEFRQILINRIDLCLTLITDIFTKAQV